VCQGWLASVIKRQLTALVCRVIETHFVETRLRDSQAGNTSSIPLVNCALDCAPKSPNLAEEIRGPLTQISVVCIMQRLGFELVP
jgi:hypothetical protein